MSPGLDVSIIVSTLNRVRELEKLLESLDALEHSDSTQVLVANNGSTDGTAELLAREQTKAHNFAFRVVEEPQKGRSRELNPNRYGREYNRAVQYRKGLSRSIYRQESIVFNVLPNLIANCIRFNFYWVLGRTQKAYKTEGRIMRYWGYLVGKVQMALGKEPWV